MAQVIDRQIPPVLHFTCIQASNQSVTQLSPTRIVFGKEFLRHQFWWVGVSLNALTLTHIGTGGGAVAAFPPIHTDPQPWCQVSYELNKTIIKEYS